jgi:hypothetical protein
VTEEYALQKTEELLDKIDFEEKFSSSISFTVHEIQEQIEQDALWNHELNDFMMENEDVFESGCVFNWMGEEEFVCYLQKRYGKSMEYDEWEEIHREVTFNKKEA